MKYYQWLAMLNFHVLKVTKSQKPSGVGTGGGGGGGGGGRA